MLIIPENILKEIFAQLPPYVVGSESTPIKFEWGNQQDLLKYLKSISGAKYPLIWLDSASKNNESYSKNTLVRKCKFFIAKSSNHRDSRNPTVYDSEFNDCLNPILENAIKALEQSGVTFLADDYTTERRSNYTEGNNESPVIDFWNVIIFETEITFKANRCVNKNIKF